MSLLWVICSTLNTDASKVSGTKVGCILCFWCSVCEYLLLSFQRALEVTDLRVHSIWCLGKEERSVCALVVLVKMSICDFEWDWAPGTLKYFCISKKMTKLCFKLIQSLLSFELKEMSYYNWHNCCSLIQWQVGLLFPSEYGTYYKFILSLSLPISPLSSYILFLDLVAIAFELFLECSFLIPRSPEYFPKVSLRNRSLPQTIMSFLCF